MKKLNNSSPPPKKTFYSGGDPGFDRGGAQIVTGLKLPFWGLSFVEFWCWGLIFGGQGGGPAPPPRIRPCYCSINGSLHLDFSKDYQPIKSCFPQIPF